jgi:hypothetical protein
LVVHFHSVDIIQSQINTMFMGKQGPKPQFVDVACPNKACELYGLTDHENVVGNGTYISRREKNYKIHLPPLRQSIQ